MAAETDNPGGAGKRDIEYETIHFGVVTKVKIMFGLSQMQPRTRAGVNIRPSDNPSGVHISHGPLDTHYRAGHRTQLLQIPANHTYTHTSLLEHVRVLAPG